MSLIPAAMDLEKCGVGLFFGVVTSNDNIAGNGRA